MDTDSHNTALPRFLIIGAQKSATSWLHRELVQHPQVFMPPKREIEYLGGPLFKKRGYKWWVSRFQAAQSGQLIGDTSVEYLFDPAAAYALKSYLDNPKFIAILRNPIDRALSAYYWYLRSGRISCATPESLLNNGLSILQSDRLSPASVQNSRDETFLDLELLMRGLYAQQLKRFSQEFPPQSLLCLPYGLVCENPTRALQYVGSHLEIDDFPRRKAKQKHPKASSYSRTLAILQRLGGRRGTHPKKDRFFEILQRTLARSGTSRRRNTLSKKTVELLLAYFEEDRQVLREMMTEADIGGEEKHLREQWDLELKRWSAGVDES